MSKNAIYDVIVVGAGHAGCEAALASARLGCSTLLLTLNMDFIALPPCNPSIGGTAKGQLVREIDALGGEMGKNIDATMIQIRMLNESKGPAVQALRAQMDRSAYMRRMKSVLETQKNLELKQALVTELLVNETTKQGSMGATANDVKVQSANRKTQSDARETTRKLANSLTRNRILGIRTSLGVEYYARAVILTTGTSLDSRIIIGDALYSGGRNGEMPAVDLSASLKKLCLKLVRWKTGTPPRINAETVDWNQVTMQPVSTEPLTFGHYYFTSHESLVISRKQGTYWWRFLEKNYPECLQGWMPQVPCFLVHTNKKTHKLVRDNFDRAPLFSGVITGVGPRYCPSFEGKVANFPDKDRHQFFLEPEGWDTTEMYVQGANTSLPEDVQLAFLRTIKGLEQVEIMRPGYAIEYDGIDTSQLLPTTENKVIRNLFCAGQINGTSGYEEAAGQGLLAGINAARTVKRKKHIWFKRSEAYLGVMMDDLINKEITEPYRLMTARSEYRLLLRTDNADLRLSEIGHEIGLLSDDQYIGFVEYKKQLSVVRDQLSVYKLKPCRSVNMKLGRVDPALKLRQTISYTEFLRRPQASMTLLKKMVPDISTSLTDKAVVSLRQAQADIAGRMEAVLRELEIQIKYEGYIGKQEELVEKFNRMENKKIPAEFDYDAVVGLRTEARQVLKRVKPLSLGQASRLSGVNPSDVAVLMVRMK